MFAESPPDAVTPAVGQKALDLLDREVLVVDVTGAIAYANAEARALIDAPMGDGSDLGTFLGLWQEGDESTRALVRRIAGSSTWQPFTLTRASGRHAGLRIHMRARAFMAGVGDDRSLQVLVTTDLMRERSFEDHRRLIRHLNLRLAEGSRTEALLTGLLESERHLRRELIHRVKNNLSLLSGLLRLNRSRLRDPEAIGQLEEMERRILAIGAVHDLLDRHHETDFVRADELIEHICRELEKALTPGTIDIERELIPVRLHISDATPLALIINELVTNALKHAFPRGSGRISIALRKNGVEKLEAVVRDDGVGVEMGLGTEENGHGTRILQSLAAQIQGEIVRQVDQGTMWQLVFAPREDEGTPTGALH
ncbi:sensor histidine kinase [Jannaschia sp. W003]|uniref:sensor histidine kinase n=1 Tax=Jannaschia sp. W003 TaxID=2867012 RepID=UPI0021A4D468|nr:sensor histidine kinase [Jannaschia sp. W003]UWQ22948.1 sensor histidine kinase [Jannaschia sp. W003]